MLAARTLPSPPPLPLASCETPPARLPLICCIGCALAQVQKAHIPSITLPQLMCLIERDELMAQDVIFFLHWVHLILEHFMCNIMAGGIAVPGIHAARFEGKRHAFPR